MRCGIFGGYHVDDIMILEGEIVLRGTGGPGFTRWRKLMETVWSGPRMVFAVNLIDGGGSWGPDEALGTDGYQGA